MKPSIVSYVGWLLVLSALGFYVYGMGNALLLSWPRSGTDLIPYAEVLSTTISSMQALLLANLGIVLGIAISKPNSAVAKQVMMNPISTRAIASAPPPPPMDLREKIQLFALVIYVLSLILCLITWGHKGFSNHPKDVVSVVAESGKMFIGVVLAYLTAVFKAA